MPNSMVKDLQRTVRLYTVCFCFFMDGFSALTHIADMATPTAMQNDASCFIFTSLQKSHTVSHYKHDKQLAEPTANDSLCMHEKLCGCGQNQYFLYNRIVSELCYWSKVHM